MSDEASPYSIRHCRGTHWHVVCGDEDLAIPGDPFDTEEAALAAMASASSRFASPFGVETSLTSPWVYCGNCQAPQSRHEKWPDCAYCGFHNAPPLPPSSLTE